MTPALYTAASEACATCGGQGEVETWHDSLHHSVAPCPDCEGGRVSVPVDRECGPCGGNGWPWDESADAGEIVPCPICNGSGRVRFPWAVIVPGDPVLWSGNKYEIHDGPKKVCAVQEDGLEVCPADHFVPVWLIRDVADLTLDVTALVASGQSHRHPVNHYTGEGQ